MLQTIRNKGWVEFINLHNRRPNLEAAMIWTLDELFWRVKYLVGDPEYGGLEAENYWSDDMNTAWRRSYEREYG